MNLKSYTLKIILISLSIFDPALSNAKNFDKIKPFIGVDISKVHQTASYSNRVRNREFDFIINKKIKYYGIFGGIKFDKNFGFEIGFELPKKNISNIDYINENENEKYLCRDTINSKNFYFGAIAEKNFFKKTKGQIFLGALVHKLKYNSETFINDYRVITVTINKTHITPMLRVAVIQDITNNLAIRATLRHRSSLKKIPAKYERFTDGYTIVDKNKIKNSCTIGIGLIYFF